MPPRRVCREGVQASNAAVYAACRLASRNFFLRDSVSMAQGNHAAVQSLSRGVQASNAAVHAACRFASRIFSSLVPSNTVECTHELCEGDSADASQSGYS
ncbi:hypothetical protein CBR_g30945 [Chara braunii]|uniref:Uncharacterized protein n=1 Tax=Chara braunii TaxID=69332 RepID=A0A388LE38_CHABU|nr:hypothetical protein CBR_g30945 [Chara braunii]|eukprot:GBG80483.1 hypothetical protein CBR_g30945 [Chara braunii]